MGPGGTDGRRSRWSLLAMALCSTLLVSVVGPAAAAPAPEVVDDEFRVVRGAVADLDVLANDLLGDPVPAGPVTIVVSTRPEVGTAEVRQPAEDLSPDGDPPPGDAVAALPTIRFTPGVAAPLGPVTFGYTVSAGDVELGSATVTGSIENAPPVAHPDEATVTSARGDVVDIAVLANDVDPDGGVLAVSSLGDPEHGRVSLAGGVVTYNPINDYVGPDGFSYAVVDGQGGSAEGVVDVRVTDSTSPMALRDDEVQAVAGTKARFDVLANDVSGGRDPLRVVSVGSASSGAEVSVRADGATVVYLAKKSYSGSDRFTYRVQDRLGNRATASVVVKVVAPPPTIDIKVSGPLTRKAVPYSYRPGCPVKPARLRRITMNYRSFSGEVRRGKLIVRKKAVLDLKYVFRRAFNDGFRIKKLKPIDVYYKDGRRSPTGSDRAAMAAGNTSAFNCRSVVGNPTKRSAHSYGIAIDINTFQNPYVVGSTFYPPAAGAYLRREPCRKGMICPGGVVAKAMRARDWPWGARWSNPDYQHFSATGG